MHFPDRRWLWLALLPLAGPVAAQQVASEAPQAWQADAKANKQAQKAAEQAAEAAMSPKQGGQAGRGPPTGGGRHGPGGEGERPEGGMGGPGGEGGPPGDGMEGRGHGGHDRHGKHGRAGGEGGGRGSPAAMLRPEMDFAAPLKDTLILYRSREAVVFGRRESADVVMLPLLEQEVPAIADVDMTASGDVPAIVDRITRKTRWISYLGLPAIVAPCGFSRRRLPISFQLLGRPYSEQLLLDLVHRYEDMTAWHRRVPDLDALPAGGAHG